MKFANRDLTEAVANVATIDKWDSPMASSLLSGKLVGRGTKSLIPRKFLASLRFHHLMNLILVERKLLQEEDNVMRARIASLMQFFQSNHTEEGGQMILNSLETYKKLLLCETDLQNKMSGDTLENLINALLIVLCHRKEYDHFNSMVRRALF